MTSEVELLWVLSLGYLLGSIPFGLVFARLMGLGDLRKIGSGNIGATNVLRTGSKTAAALTVIFDAGKAALALIAAGWFFDTTTALLAGSAAIVGHCFSVFLGFRGGKGVATFLGMTLAFNLAIGLMCIGGWLLGAGVSRRSSAGALVTTLVPAPTLLYLGHWTHAIIFAAMAGIVWVRHHENIARLLSGEEPKIKWLS